MHENGEQEQSPPSRQHGLCPGADSSRTCPPQNSSFSLLPPLASARTRHPLTVQGCLSHPRSYWSSCGGRNFPCRPPWVCLRKDIRGGLCGSCLGRSHLRGYPSAWGTQPHTCSRRETSLCSGLSVPQPCPSTHPSFSSDQHFKHVSLIQNLSNKSTFKHFLISQSFSTVAVKTTACEDPWHDHGWDQPQLLVEVVLLYGYTLD